MGPRIDGRTATLGATALIASVLAVRETRMLPLLIAGAPKKPAPAAAPRDAGVPDALEAIAASADEEMKDAPAEAAAAGTVAPNASGARVRAARSRSAVPAEAPASAARRGAGASAAAPESSAASASIAAATKAADARRPGEAPRAAPGETRRATPESRAPRPDAAPRRPPEPPRARHDFPSKADAPLPPVRTSSFDRLGRVGSDRGAAGSFHGRAGGRSPLFAAAALRARPHSEATHRAPAKFHPLLLAKLLGRRPLRAPPVNAVPPRALASLDARLPSKGPKGSAIPRKPATLAELERLDPAALPADRRAAPHWDGPYYHAGAARGAVRDGSWAWLYRDGSRWWAKADDGSALLRHDGVWWTKERGIWFVVHGGEPWAWRSFHDWDAEGLFHPGTGTEMVYSHDFRRVALVVPGRGAEVYDAESGEELARIPEAEMPARRRPQAPASLTLP